MRCDTTENTAVSRTFKRCPFLRRAAATASLVIALGSAASAQPRDPSVLSFDHDTVPIGDLAHLTFTVDATLVGDQLVLYTGTNLGPTRVLDQFLPVGGFVLPRDRFTVSSPVMTMDYTLRSEGPGKTLIAMFTTSSGDTITSSSNVVSIQFGTDEARFKSVPISGEYGWFRGDMKSTSTFYGVSFADELNGFAAGPESTLWVTNNGGQTWNPRKIDSSLTAYLRDVEFVDSQHGWTIGSYFTGLCWYTVNGGQDWSMRSVNVVPLALDFVDSRYGWIVGLPSPFGGGGPIFRTTDGGVTWRSQANGLQAELRTVRFADRDHGIAAGRDGVVMMTSDGGVNWRRVTLPAAYADTYFMCADYLPNGRTAYLGGFDSVVLKTDDAGETWQRLMVKPDRVYYSINFTSEQRGWLTGEKGTILWTFDGGETWLPFDSRLEPGRERTARFYSVRSIDRDSAWTVGNDGMVRRFTTVDDIR